MVNLIIAGSIKRPQLCIVNNNIIEQQRKMEKTRKNRGIERNRKLKGKTERVTKRKKDNERKQKCDKSCTNRLLPSLPLNSLPSGQPRDLRISHLGPFF